MIVGMVTDFQMTFTGDLFNICWQINGFAFKISIPPKMAIVLSKIQVTDLGTSWPYCFSFVQFSVCLTCSRELKIAGKEKLCWKWGELTDGEDESTDSKYN